MSLPELSYVFAKTYGILVIGQDERFINILLREGSDGSAIGEVRRQFGVPLHIAGSLSAAAFEAKLAEIYAQGEGHAAEVMHDIGQDVDLKKLMLEIPQVEDLLETRNDAPIVRLVNALFTQAVHEHASDIHVEPYENHSMIRFRRDGLLGDVAKPHQAIHAALVSRLKIMAELDIAEKRIPQDGRIALRIGNRAIDVRVSAIPTTHGERLVMRLLDKESSRMSLEALGMPPETRDRFGLLMDQPHGLILVTGPTGSGKTTTLYAALQTLDKKKKNIITVEDPVEYDLYGVGQIQVNPRINLGFGRALRSVLRQDPDVIMIGEIRDSETAQIAVQASITGHLVLATLHTNDAAAAITRMIDLGVERFLLASCLRGVLAQRLLRCLCAACKKLIPSTESDQQWLSQNHPTVWSNVGCSVCNQTGYDGRTGIYELLVTDEKGAELIHDGASDADFRKHARSTGTRSLREDGARLVSDGKTSLSELIRATRD